MSDVKLPLSRRHLDIAIERLAPRFGDAQRIRRAVANTIVAQLMPDCVIKGGSSLKFRYGDIATRVTKDMDAAQGADLDAFITRLDEALNGGWNGFTGHVVRREPATPEDVPPAYVMHPFDVKLDRLPGDAGDTIRLVRIGDYDVCPCIGKHVRSTSQIGRFEMLGTNWDEHERSFRVRFKVIA